MTLSRSDHALLDALLQLLAEEPEAKMAATCIDKVIAVNQRIGGLRLQVHARQNASVLFVFRKSKR